MYMYNVQGLKHMFDGATAMVSTVTLLQDRPCTPRGPGQLCTTRLLVGSAAQESGSRSPRAAWRQRNLSGGYPQKIWFIMVDDG